MINVKLHDLLDDMLDSRSKVRILRLLFRFPEREFTEREIAKMIGMSPNTVNLAMHEFRKTNVFLYKRIGRTHAYRCNPDSVLFSLLGDLISEEKQMREDLLALLRDRLKGVGTCILFGSFARKEESFDSDLDLLIVTGNKGEAGTRTQRLAEELLRKFSITLAPMLFSVEEFGKKRQKKFIKEALSEGIVIVKDGLEI